MSTLAFTSCFAVWTIFSIIGVQLKDDLGLNETQFGLLVATPILTGSLSRIFLGIWADQYGGRIVYVAVMITAAFATLLLSFVDTYLLMLLAALSIGLAGGTFAVGVASAGASSRCCPCYSGHEIFDREDGELELYLNSVFVCFRFSMC